MFRYFTCLIALISINAFAEDSIWPNGAKAAVSLAYDDSLNTHLDVAIPQLDKYNFKGSFYLALGSHTITTRLKDWRAIANNGHELGNHTLNHSCRAPKNGSRWIKDWNDLKKRAVEEVAFEILTANRFLNAIDGKEARTYTAPCGHWETKDGNYLEAVKPYFDGIKGHISREPQDIKNIDPHFTHIITPTSATTGEELIAFVKKAAEKGSIAGITFHGVGGDHIPVSAEAHEELLAYLDANRDTYWVDSFINIINHYKTHTSNES